MRAISARSISLGALGALASFVAVVGLACSTFTPQPDEPGPAEASGFDAADSTPLSETSVPDGSAPEATADAGHDAQFSLSCGASACTVPGDACCFDPRQGPPTAFHCAKASDVCDPNQANASRYTCDDDDDCIALGKVGNVCCGSLVPNGKTYYLGAATCVLPESCVAHDEVRRCDRSIAGQCPPGKLCLDLEMYPDATDAGLVQVTPKFPACQR